MENKERFLTDLLYHTREGKVQWRLPLKQSTPRHVSEIQQRFAASAFVSHSGKEDCFSYYIIKANLEVKEEYIFLVYLKGSPCFSLRQREMDSPFLLKALYDAAFKLNKNTFTNYIPESEADFPEDEQDWKARAIAAEKEVKRLQALVSEIKDIAQTVQSPEQEA